MASSMCEGSKSQLEQGPATGMVLRRRQGPRRCREEEQRQWDPQEGREAWWPEGTRASRQGREQDNREPRVLAWGLTVPTWTLPPVELLLPGLDPKPALQ